jgi:two-component system NtrC family sensor kinase
MSLTTKFWGLTLVLTGFVSAALSWAAVVGGSPVASVWSRELVQVSAAVSCSILTGMGAIALLMLQIRLFKPLREISSMAAAVGAGNFGKRLGFVRQDQISRLALELDALSDQLEAARDASEAQIEALEQLRHSDRVATLGRLASSVAHELGNPLNVVEMRAQIIVTGDAATLAEARQNAEIIVAQARRMTRIIDGILSFARRQPARIAVLDLVSVVRNAIALSEHTAKKRALSIQLEAASPSIDVHGDADKLLQIVVNLVLNGVAVTEAGGVVTVKVGMRAPSRLASGPAEPYASIEVVDRGAGIPKEALPRIFDPFFSSKPSGEGTGLGLSIAQGIAKEHDGWIEVDSELGRGSHFTVFLPRNGRKDDHGHDWQPALRR